MNDEHQPSPGDEGEGENQNSNRRRLLAILLGALLVVLLAAIAGSGGLPGTDTSSNVNVTETTPTPTPDLCSVEPCGEEDGTPVKDETNDEQTLTPTVTPTPSEPVLVSDPTTATGADISSPMSCDATGADYTVSGGNIQSVINQATPGDKILVESGSYSTSLSIDKPLTLVGKDATLKGNSENVGIKITSGDVAVCGFELTNYRTGVYVRGMTNDRLEQVHVKDISVVDVRNSDGIHMVGVSQGSVTNVDVIGVHGYRQNEGIYVGYSNDILVSSTSIQDVTSRGGSSLAMIEVSNITVSSFNGRAGMSIGGSNIEISGIDTTSVSIGCHVCEETTGVAVTDSIINRLSISGSPVYLDIQQSVLNKVSTTTAVDEGHLDLTYNYWGDDNPSDQINVIGDVDYTYEPYCTDKACSSTSG